MSPLVVVCRLCLNLTEIFSPVSYLTIFLEAVLPDVDLTLTKDPVVCKQCADSVTSSFNFKYKCMEQEKKVRKHYNETKNLVDLYALVEESCYTVTNDTEHGLVVKGTINVKFKFPCENPDNIKQGYYENQVANGMEETKESVMDNGDMSNVVEIVESDIVDMSDDETDYPNDMFLKELPCKLPNNNDKFDAVSNRKATEDIVRKTKKSRRKPPTSKKGLRYKLTQHSIIHKKDEVDKYVCSECDFQTIHKRYLKTHVLLHKKVFKCTECSYESPRSYDLKNHSLKHSKDTLFCAHCDYRTEEKEKLSRHCLVHATPGKIKKHVCSDCGYKAWNNIALYRHRLNHRKSPEIYKCDECSFQSIHKKSLRDHLLIHKNREDLDMHKCEQCRYQTFRKSDLKKHLLIHKNPEDIDMHKCEHCRYQTFCTSNLKKHLLIHKNPEDIDMHKCEHCRYQTFRTRDLKKHLLIHKNPEDIDMHKCEHCRYQTFRTRDLKKHLLIHKNPKHIDMHKCEQCRYQTFRKSDLTKHLLLHKNPEDLDMHKCEQCRYQTFRKRDFKKHLLIHKNPKNIDMHKCEHCRYQTFRKIDLKKHLRIHKKPEEINLHR